LSWTVVGDRLQSYEGGYTAYREEKARRWQNLLLDYEAQEKYRARLAADIEATKGRALGVELSTRLDTARPLRKKVAKKAKAREKRPSGRSTRSAGSLRPQTRPRLSLAFPR